MIQRGFRYRLYPTAEQEELLAQFVGVTRFVYNLCWEQRTQWWRPGRRFNLITQNRELTQLRAEVDWIAAVHSTPLTNAIRDLDRAFANFFAGRAGFPTPRRKGLNDSIRFKGSEVRTEPLSARWSLVRVPKIGLVRYRDTRPLRGVVTSVTVSKGALGWFVMFVCQIEHEAQPSTLPAVGIDRGVANTLALSTGELLSTTDTTRLERRKKRAQRILARRVRGSNRYRKQRERLARINAKIARVRVDWRHRASLDISGRFGAVVLEDLQTANMTRKGRGKRGLNRSIQEQGWRAFESTLAYKLQERGGTLVKINPAFTSQECSECGVIDRASRESQSSFACRHCGFADHADINAAKVILRRSTPELPVEASGYGAVEAGTVNHAALAA